MNSKIVNLFGEWRHLVEEPVLVDDVEQVVEKGSWAHMKIQTKIHQRDNMNESSTKVGLDVVTAIITLQFVILQADATKLVYQLKDWVQ